MKELLNAKPALGMGIALGRENLTEKLWVNGRNVVFGEGQIQADLGYVSQGEHTSKLTELATAKLISGEVVYFGTGTSFGKWTGTFNELSTGYTGGDWNLIPYGQHLIASNGVEALKYYNGTTVTTPTTPFAWAKLVYNYSPYIIALNTSNGGNIIEWNSRDDITDWTPTTINTAGNYTLRDVESDIKACAPLANALGIYTENQLFYGKYVGGEFVFSFTPALQGIGAVSKKAVTSDGKLNYGLSRQGFWVTDGVGKDYIQTNEVEAFLRNYLNYSSLSGVKSYHDPRNTTVWWCLPIEGSLINNIALGFDYKHSVWTMSDVVTESQIPQGVYATPVLAVDAVLAYGWSGNLSSWVQTKPLGCGKELIWKRFQALKLEFTGTGFVDIGVSETLDGTIDWFEVGLPLSPLVHFKDREGVYLHLKFYSDAFWKLTQLYVLGEEVGTVI